MGQHQCPKPHSKASFLGKIDVRMLGEVQRKRRRYLFFYQPSSVCGWNSTFLLNAHEVYDAIEGD